MNVRVAIVNLTRGGLSGGYIKYLRALVPRLARHPGIDRLDVFVPPPARDRLREEPWPMLSWPDENGSGSFAGLKQAVRERRPDVVFVPTARWLDVGDIPVVVMVRNMEPLQVPLGGNPPREAMKNLARRFVARRSCARAARIIAVSSHVSRFLIERWRIPPQKIGVVHHGVDASADGPAPRRPSSLRGLDQPFLLTAGSIRPARGLTDVIDALPLLRGAGHVVTAVVAGGVDPGMEGHVGWLTGHANALGVADRILFTGPLDAAEMRWCFEASAVFLMTSRAEACPNVALEAMSYGCACVSGDRPPMPEMFGQAAVYYRTGDGAALATALIPLLSGGGDAVRLKTAAGARAAQFDWQMTAEKTVTELRTVLRSCKA